MTDAGNERDWLDAVRWNEHGLVTAVAQDAASGEVLMLAWMNRESLAETAATGRAVYWSRSRGRLWRKGEESGHVQHVREIRLDCDGDAVLLKVEQQGEIACHTGRRSCFFRRLDDAQWSEVDPVLKDPAEIYR
ncbi:MAG: phosphoribosyl-AMP cyclohydrolase [Burkholderiaceae bacterium]|jgi:phosphoribosyl-AMP cyclohydrolase|nr:phosphoribosyl-AMP cyclohydrolase [Burkholderiaceae bacterium]